MEAGETVAPQHCLACGAELASQNHVTACPSCGAPFPEEAVPDLSEAQRAALLELIEQANTKLSKIGADRAEQSFGLGCLVVALPVGLAIVILTLLGIFNIIMLLVALVMTAMTSTGIAAMLAISARNRSIRETYHKEVQPEIEQTLHLQNLSAADFDRLVHRTLPSDAPLRAFRPLESPEIVAL